MLEEYVEQPLVTNQVEISPVCLEHFDNGNIDYFIKRKIHPMAWSPMAGGKLVNPEKEKLHRLHNTLKKIASELKVDSIDKVIYSWLLKHPTQIMPIIGTGKIERIKNAVESMEISMTLEQWYRIYTASRGEDVP
jgi:predicted oxidoreductase